MTDPAHRIDFANLPTPAEGILVTLFITVRKVARSRDFYSRAKTLQRGVRDATGEQLVGTHLPFPSVCRAVGPHNGEVTTLNDSSQD